MRLHPLLGYTRLHPGIDFGAPSGTPVFAAGDGVVEEARWAGGYGHWLKLKHAQGWETGYGHLSAYASGIKPGTHVKQGQVVAYVGSTGLSTGPHLHYELIRGGAKMDPHSAKLPEGSILNARDIAAFKAEKLQDQRHDRQGRPDLEPLRDQDAGRRGRARPGRARVARPHGRRRAVDGRRRRSRAPQIRGSLNLTNRRLTPFSGGSGAET